MSGDELAAAGHEPLPMTAEGLAEASHFCIACRGGWLSDVRGCATVSCGMWPYRMGSDPFSVGAPPLKARAVAKGIITEDRPGGFIAFVGEIPDYTDAERKALLEGLRTQGQENRAKARQQRTDRAITQGRQWHGGSASGAS